MPNTQLDTSRLKTSTTKFDSVKVIDVVGKNELLDYVNGTKSVDVPTLRAFLGVNALTDTLPYYWNKLPEFPETQRRLFALLSSIFTHYDVVELFASQYSSGDMQGIYKLGEGKVYTNIRSALVVGGAADKTFRTKGEVPYDLSRLFESGDLGVFFKEVLKNRLIKINADPDTLEEEFYNLSFQLNFHKAMGLSESQFKEWTSGKGLSRSLTELLDNGITYEKYGKIKVLKVRQWLTAWDNVPRYNELNRRKPLPYFYLFNIPALLLKRLYNVHHRMATIDRVNEQYSQRRLSEARSKEIKEFVKGGFPWSTISESQRLSDSYQNLQMPGWLPTSIIANILEKGSKRKGLSIEDSATVEIKDIDENFAEISIPESVWSDKWQPGIAPIEIIDGQHRIKAFDDVKKLEGNFDFPMIAFHDLDFTWQAYLFYTINIKPKRINTSLAYDLMPLLRIQEWLEQDIDGPEIYRKVRAQELTEFIWKYPYSPWYKRINMLGDSGGKAPVSQNAFISSLTVSFIKKWEGKIGGLFGGELNEGKQDVIYWDKEMQAAFLIFLWQCIYWATKRSKSEWAVDLRGRVGYDLPEHEKEMDLAFIHPFSFLTTDQGIRPILFILNDMCFEGNDYIKLSKISSDIDDYEKYDTNELLTILIHKFKEDKTLVEYIETIAGIIVDGFDWRTPSAFNPNDIAQDKVRQNQNQFRGSSGYKELRRQLLRIICESNAGIDVSGTNLRISDIAAQVKLKLDL